MLQEFFGVREFWSRFERFGIHYKVICLISDLALVGLSSSLIPIGSRFQANLMDVAIIFPRSPFWSGAGKLPLLLARVVGPVCSWRERRIDLDRHANVRHLRSAICSMDGRLSWERISVIDMSRDLWGILTTALMAWLQAHWRSRVWLKLRNGRYAPPPFEVMTPFTHAW